MRRNVRRNNQNEDVNKKIIKYSCISIAVVIVIIAGILLYSKKVNSDAKKGMLTDEQITGMLNTSNDNENTAMTGVEIGKSVEESKNELKNDSKNTTTNNETKKSTSQNKTLSTQNVVPSTNSNSKESKTQNNIENNQKEEETTLLSFEKPVEGDIVRDFSVDNLIYSDTLQEWTTHTGIDIKADKTTVVKAAEAGTVKTIKNDPRFGLTIIVEHPNGFETVYSNLLTSEFVVEGEKVQKGQSLGTVGNTASFEIADEPHLHFEILKDSSYVNPNNYLK